MVQRQSTGIYLSFQKIYFYSSKSLILGDRSGNILFFLNNEDFQEIFRRKVQNEPLCLLCAQGKNFVATASANRVTLWVFSHSEGEEHLDFFAELLRVDVFDSSEEQLNTAQYVQSLDMHSSFILFGIRFTLIRILNKLIYKIC